MLGGAAGEACGCAHVLSCCNSINADFLALPLSWPMRFVVAALACLRCMLPHAIAHLQHTRWAFSVGHSTSWLMALNA